MVAINVSAPHLPPRVLHQFNPLTEGVPAGDLLLASDGHLYGLTRSTNSVIQLSNGTASSLLFRLTLSNVFIPIHAFPPGAQQAVLSPPLIQATDGWLYGIMQNPSGFGCFLFRCDLKGNLSSVWTFQGLGVIAAPLTQAVDGHLYGVSRDDGGSTVQVRARHLPIPPPAAVLSDHRWILTSPSLPSVPSCVLVPL